MKRVLSLLLIIVLLVTNAFLFSSCKIGASEGLVFTLNKDRETVTLVGTSNCVDADVVIPARFNGKKVTAIGDDAFCDHIYVRSITIPASVVSIGKNVLNPTGYTVSFRIYLEKIRYKGTMEQWKDIVGINYVYPDVPVICKDGTLYKDGSNWVEK